MLEARKLLIWPELEAAVRRRVKGEKWPTIWLQLRKTDKPLSFYVALGAITVYRKAGLTEQQSRQIDLAIRMPVIVVGAIAFGSVLQTWGLRWRRVKGAAAFAA